MIVADETARQCLHATREKLYGKPTREVEPSIGRRESSINLYQREYDEAERYLPYHGYIEPY